MTDTPITSVVICSYNRAKTLGPALESIVSQETDPALPFEIVVIDDGSTDETEQIVGKIAAQSRVPVRYILESGKGVPGARNRGVKEAFGEWIAFFDDDQIAGNNWLHELMRTAQETGAEIVGGVRRLQFTAEESPDLGPLTREILGEKYYGSRICRSNRYTLACTGNVLIRRALFGRIGYFDTNMHRGMSDIDLMRRAFDAGIPSWYSPHAIVFHLIPPNRLKEDYIKRTSLRVGTNLSHINYKSWGPIRMLLPCLLRIVHASSVNLLMEQTARISRNPSKTLERKCYRWIATGSSRMALHFLFPEIFVQEEFLGNLSFRIPPGVHSRKI